MYNPGLIETISSICILLGVAAMIIAAVGIIRLPDFYTRNSATTKAVTLGVGLILLGIGIYFNDLVIGLKLTSIILFIVLTTPISAFVITRAAYKDRVPFWHETDLIDFEDKMREEDAIPTEFETGRDKKKAAIKRPRP